MTKTTTSFVILFLWIFFTLSARSQSEEQLKIAWPEEYHWKVGSDQETNSHHLIELIPENESLNEWSIIGTMFSFKDVKHAPVEAIMNLLFEQTKKTAVRPTLTVIEKNDTAKNAWIIFKIESPKFKKDKTPESQLYYLLQGNTSLYSNFVAIKEKTLSDDFVAKWSKIFRNSELIYQ